MSKIDYTRDYYAILGVPTDAPAADIKKAHLQLVLKNHPDIVGKSPLYLERFRAIQEAYKVLSTLELRRDYDHARLRAEATNSVRGFTMPKYERMENFSGRTSQLAAPSPSNWEERIEKNRTRGGASKARGAMTAELAAARKVYPFSYLCLLYGVPILAFLGINYYFLVSKYSPLIDANLPLPPSEVAHVRHLQSIRQLTKKAMADYDAKNEAENRAEEEAAAKNGLAGV